MKNGKLGVWLIGARGSIACHVIAGVTAIEKKLCSSAGLVSASRELNGHLPLAPLGSLVFGGYDIRTKPLWECAREIGRVAASLRPEILAAAKSALQKADREIKIGTGLGCGPTIRSLTKAKLMEDSMTLAQIVRRIQSDLKSFQRRHKLDRLIALDIASTEPYREVPAHYRDLGRFREAIAKNRKNRMSAGALYAYAILDMGVPFINFTPTLANDAPALQELALERGVPHAGKDGKTGETLMKTHLAPMFPARNLRVLSWEGYNIFGNNDAVVLDDPKNNAAKTKGKDASLRSILQDPAMHTRVRIDYVPSLDDWKTAWDFIHYQGFLDTKMIVQFIWQGCDSVLAAPLAIDLVRLTDLAARRGETGVLAHLGCFFKSPLGTGENAFLKQHDALLAYVQKCENR